MWLLKPSHALPLLYLSLVAASWPGDLCPHAFLSFFLPVSFSQSVCLPADACLSAGLHFSCLRVVICSAGMPACASSHSQLLIGSLMIKIWCDPLTAGTPRIVPRACVCARPLWMKIVVWWISGDGSLTALGGCLLHRRQPTRLTGGLSFLL